MRAATAAIASPEAAAAYADAAMAASYALVDLACRPDGKPAVLVPYPYATADHQSANAGFMESAGAAVVIPDSELTPARLANEVGRLLADRGRLAAMGRASAAVARPNAAGDIARELLAVAQA